MKNNISSLRQKYKKYEKMNDDQLLRVLLLKKATGFVLEEISEEFDFNDESKPIKRKIVAKEVPPDISAIKYFIESKNLSNEEYSSLSDDELKNEKNRLLNLLKEDNEF